MPRRLPRVPLIPPAGAYAPGKLGWGPQMRPILRPSIGRYGRPVAGVPLTGGQAQAIVSSGVISTYSIFQPGLPSGTSQNTDSETWDLGLQFKATAACALAGYWWYLPASGNTTGTVYSFRLYSTTNGTSGTLISGSSVTGAGTWTAGAWNFTSLSAPVTLVSGTTYVAVISISTATSAYYQRFFDYWASASSVVSGPVTAPDAAAALGGNQQPFDEPTTGGFPTSTNDTYYGLDVSIQQTSGVASASVSVGPQGLGTIWYPAQAVVSTTTGLSGGLDNSTCNIYLGPPGAADPNLLIGQVIGGNGVLAAALPPMAPGQYLTATWAGANPGDVAGINVVGVMNSVTFR